MVRPERFELPTLWFEAKCSIQLSYGRTFADDSSAQQSYRFASLGLSRGRLQRLRRRGFLNHRNQRNGFDNVQSRTAEKLVDHRAR